MEQAEQGKGPGCARGPASPVLLEATIGSLLDGPSCSLERQVTITLFPSALKGPLHSSGGAGQTKDEAAGAAAVEKGAQGPPKRQGKVEGKVHLLEKSWGVLSFT